MSEQLQYEVKTFVEHVGIVFEETGIPRMAGRIFGWLLICDPPHQSADELADVLMASKGSISSMTRLLIQIGFIERFGMPGVRYDLFRIKTDAWQHLIKRGLEDEIKMFRQLAEHGIELTTGNQSLTQQRLREMFDTYAFFENEFPALVDKWKEVRKTNRLNIS